MRTSSRSCAQASRASSAASRCGTESTFYASSRGPIDQPRIGDCRGVRKHRRLELPGSKDMEDRVAGGEQIVRDNPAVTSPPDRFGTHYSRNAPAAELDEPS